MSATNEADRGYIFLQVEQYGFDEEVLLIVQEHGKFRDYQLANNATDKITRVYKVHFGSRFYIPAEYDLLISFEPLKAASG